MKRYVFFVFTALLRVIVVMFWLTGCRVMEVQTADTGGTFQGDRDSLVLCNWNLQTFFDAVKDGTEYTDFQKSEYWGRDAYAARLERLCHMMKTVNADVFCFEEMENAGIIQDVTNQFAGENAWAKGKSWNYSCFSKESGAAIGCAVFSKFPIVSVKHHSLDIRAEENKQPSMRPILEVEIQVPGKEKVLTLFVNHWKSKSGGEQESEVWRNWQETVLARLLLTKSAAVCTGDFNRDVWEFETDLLGKENRCLTSYANGKENLYLRFSPGKATVYVPVYNPWIKDGRNAFETGSYLFDREWERIDHIMAYGDVDLSDFTPCTDGPWCDEIKNPVPFKVYTGFGYSDHIPVCARVIF